MGRDTLATPLRQLGAAHKIPKVPKKVGKIVHNGGNAPLLLVQRHEDPANFEELLVGGLCETAQKSS